MSEVTRRRDDERGVAMSSVMALLSAAAVALAGAAFVATEGSRNDPGSDRPAQVSARVSPSVSPSGGAPRAAVRKKQARKPVVRRGDTYVEVFNNSGISGLAGSTAARAQGAGWQVVGSDNWFGTIDASTVYYPPRLREQAGLLAKDLGISRTKPIIAPMRGDRLTVILTADHI